MDFLQRSNLPGYRGKAKQPVQAGTGFLSGLWCYLFGSRATPTYRTKHEDGATAPVVSRCWWSVSATPQYKAPPEAAPSDQDSQVPPCGGLPTESDCSCDSEPGVEPREIHFIPG